MKFKIPSFILKHKKLSILLGLLFILLLWLLIYFISFDRGILDKNIYSTTFYDRSGKELRTYFSSEETYSRSCKLSEISPHFLRAIVLIEDKNFYEHKGVVLSSLFRAIWQNIKGGDVVSGGSTITMQLTKAVYYHRSRNIFNKVSEIFSALRFEMHLSKPEILEAYINRLPFSNMIHGVNDASRFYFGKAPSQLSLNQAIYLALIPKSPARFNPNRNLGPLTKRWEKILEIFKRNNYISEDEYMRAKSEGIEFQVTQPPFLAPHFIELVKERFKDNSLPEKVYTTLDYQVQKDMEGLIREHLVRLQRYRVKSAAAVVIDNRLHQVIGFVGSPDYFDKDNAGTVNLATAMRQPGSTLKPFVYALALEKGYTPSTILPDIKFPARGGFFPQDHDGREHGPLRLRVALACSYNIPAFYLAMKLKPVEVIDKLQQLGFKYLKSDPGFYGETIALGSGEVTLLDLVCAYSAFANKGIVYSPGFTMSDTISSRQVIDPHVSFLLFDILSDPSARFASFGYDSSMNLPFPVAVKTGTSKGFRDKWAIGVNSWYTIGVWIGNPEGENMADMSNVGSAPTIMRDIFLSVQKDWTQGGLEMPNGIVRRTVCALSGELASPLCPDTVDEYFDERHLPSGSCSWHRNEDGQVRTIYSELYRKWANQANPSNRIGIDPMKEKGISFPQPGDFFYISDAVPVSQQQITFEVVGFVPGEPIDYYIDGVFYKKEKFPKFPFWQLQKGDHRLTVKIGSQVVDNVSFIVR